jgi:acyl-CoA thioester hydrolase
MRLHVPIKLRWSDLDAYGHVNNAAMLTLLEESRISVFWHGDLGVDGVQDAAAPTTDGGPGGDTLTLIARQEVEYLAPIPYLREPLRRAASRPCSTPGPSPPSCSSTRRRCVRDG